MGASTLTLEERIFKAQAQKFLHGPRIADDTIRRTFRSLDSEKAGSVSYDIW